MNEFIWTDLSTYNLSESVAFYTALFDWKFINTDDYYVGGSNGSTYVGIYETPDFFKRIKMPHFWMNYIQVDHLYEVIKKAKTCGGKVELEDVPFYGGSIALIRDPMGAGFTVYEGRGLGQYHDTSYHLIKSRELHTSVAKDVIPFYQALFNWNIKDLGDNQYEVVNVDGKNLGHIRELPNQLKGSYEYWVTEFKVSSLSKAADRLKALGGAIISDEEYRILATDQFKQAFFYMTSVD